MIRVYSRIKKREKRILFLFINRFIKNGKKDLILKMFILILFLLRYKIYNKKKKKLIKILKKKNKKRKIKKKKKFIINFYKKNLNIIYFYLLQKYSLKKRIQFLIKYSFYFYHQKKKKVRILKIKKKNKFKFNNKSIRKVKIKLINNKKININEKNYLKNIVLLYNKKIKKNKKLKKLKKKFLIAFLNKQTISYILNNILLKLRPILGIKPKFIAGLIYYIPRFIDTNKEISLALTWLRKGLNLHHKSFYLNLSLELENLYFYPHLKKTTINSLKYKHESYSIIVFNRDFIYRFKKM